jgi:hypothetical protein
MQLPKRYAIGNLWPVACHVTVTICEPDDVVELEANRQALDAARLYSVDSRCISWIGSLRRAMGPRAGALTRGGRRRPFPGIEQQFRLSPLAAPPLARRVHMDTPRVSMMVRLIHRPVGPSDALE